MVRAMSPDLRSIIPPDLPEVQGFVCKLSTKARNLQYVIKGREGRTSPMAYIRQEGILEPPLDMSVGSTQQQERGLARVSSQEKGIHWAE